MLDSRLPKAKTLPAEQQPVTNVLLRRTSQVAVHSLREGLTESFRTTLQASSENTHRQREYILPFFFPESANLQAA